MCKSCPKKELPSTPTYFVPEEGGMDENKASQVQIGGSHYKHLPIQPMEYSFRNTLDPCQHTVIKYVTRFRSKGGKEDLIKAKHCIDLLIQLEYGDEEK